MSHRSQIVYPFAIKIKATYGNEIFIFCFLGPPRTSFPTGFNVILLHFLPPEILRGDVFARCALPIVSSSSEAKDLDGNDL